MILEIYNEVFENIQLNFMVNASKAIGGIIVIVMLSKMVFKSYSENGKVFAINTDSESGLSPYKLLRMLFLLLMIGFSTQILELADGIMGSIESEAYVNIKEMPDKIQEVYQTEREFNIQNLGFWDKILNQMNEIIKVINPLNWFGMGTSGFVYIILTIIEMIRYPLFLMQRFFVMGLIKIFFPLMIAFSLFDKTKDYVFEIMKVYLRTYLVIIPWIFVNMFGNTMVNGIMGKLSSNVSGVTSSVMAVSEGMIWAVLMIMLIFFKFKAYNKSREFMKDIIK